MSRSAIRFDNVTLTYDRHPAVHHLSGVFEAGSLTAVAGPNGAGKSTLLKALVGELSPAEGKVDRGGLLVRDLAYLPQAAEIDRHFPLSVADIVILGAWQQTGAFGGVTRQIADKAGQFVRPSTKTGLGAEVFPHVETIVDTAGSAVPAFDRTHRAYGGESTSSSVIRPREDVASRPPTATA